MMACMTMVHDWMTTRTFWRLKTVCNDATEQTEDQHRHAAGDVDTGGRRVNEPVSSPHEPASRQHVGVHPGSGAQLADPQVAEVRNGE